MLSIKVFLLNTKVNMISKSTKYILIGLGVLSGVGLVFVYYKINPAGQDWIPKCPFHSTTGLHCPGCGSQRALHDFLHGNIIEGFRHNFLMGLGIMVLLYKLFIILRTKFFNYNQNNVLLSPKTPWVILTLIIVFWILRNIPLYPFTLLAP
jgi:hypothetical protein